jgi:hypothetical protein
MEHFKAQAKVGIPMMLYNIPGRCGGSGMTSATIAEVYSLPSPFSSLSSSLSPLPPASPPFIKSPLSSNVSHSLSLSLSHCALSLSLPILVSMGYVRLRLLLADFPVIQTIFWHGMSPWAMLTNTFYSFQK